MNAAFGARILCMEDDAGMAYLLRRELERHAHSVVLADNGSEGLARLDEGTFDVVIVDYWMPILDGMGVLRALGQRPGSPPPIMLTAQEDLRVAIDVLKAGAIEYVVKDAGAAYLELLPTVIAKVIERRKLETGLRQAQDMLHRTHDDLERTQQAAQIGTWEWDPSRDRLTQSAQNLRNLGLSPGVATGSFERFVAAAAPIDRKKLERALQTCRAERHGVSVQIATASEDRQIAVQCRPANGSAIIGITRPLVTVSFGATNGAKPTGRAAAGNGSSGVPVTREERTDPPVDLFRSLGREARRALNTIIGLSELMRHELLGSMGVERYRHYAADICDSGWGLLRLVEDLTDIGRLQGGTVQLEMVALELSQVLNDAIAPIRDQATRQRIAIRLAPLPDLPPVIGDPRSVRRIFANLLECLVRVTAGSEVVIRASAEDPGVTVLIHDPATVLLPPVLDRFMRPVDRLEDALTQGGDALGPGLPLAKALLQAHGGRLTVTSAQGEGTRMSIHLPTAVSKPH